MIIDAGGAVSKEAPVKAGPLLLFGFAVSRDDQRREMTSSRSHEDGDCQYNRKYDYAMRSSIQLTSWATG